MHNPFAPTPLADRLIGNAFPVVREVHDNLPKLLYLSENVDALTEQARSAVTQSSAAISTSGETLTKADAALLQAQSLAATSASAVQQAADSAVSAQLFRDATKNLLDTFGRYWLGEHKADPTADNLGNPLIVGAFYLNTASVPSVVRTYTTSGWQVPSTPDTVLSSAIAAVSQANAAAAAAASTASQAQAAAASYALVDGSKTLTTLKVQNSLVRGTEQSVAIGGTIAGMQNSGTSTEGGSIGSSLWSADSNGPAILLGKSRGAAIGAQGSVLSGDTLGSVQFSGSDGTSLRQAARVAAVAAESFNAASRGTRLDFETTRKGTVDKTVSMRLSDAGRLLIGTTNDNEADLLQIAGSAKVTSLGAESVSTTTLSVAGTAEAQTVNAGAGGVTTSGNMSCQDQTVKGTATVNAVAAKSVTSDAADIGAITARTVTASVNVTLSDERLKTNWRSLDPDFLERLAGVKFGIYDWKYTEESQVGVSAQSMEAVLPDVVSMVGEDHRAVAYGNAALVSVIALTQRVLQLEERLHSLESA